MPDKRREQRHLLHLQRLLPDFPSGSVEPGERPDFIVRSASKVTGIEFTEFHLPPSTGEERPHQEVQALKDRVVTAAWRIHVEAGGPALYVSVFFREPSSLTKRVVRPLAEAVVRAVAQTPVLGFPESSSVPWELLPPQIVDISIRASFDGRDQIWSADAGGWVAPIRPEHIEAVIHQKHEMLPIAKSKCGEVWLVVVHDVFSRAAASELNEAATGYAYDSSFERVLWLEPHAARVLTLC